jgi:hypothetical protein
MLAYSTIRTADIKKAMVFNPRLPTKEDAQ